MQPYWVKNQAALLLALAVCLHASGCKTLVPSNERDWSPDQAILPYAIDMGDYVYVKNVRNCNYITADDYVVDYYDKRVDLRKVESVDFVVCPFNSMPLLAHTMLSFGFEGGDYLAVSVEIRKEKGESFAAWKGGMRQYEIMYVLGDERDLIKLRTNYRHEDVYVYRTTATSEQAQMLLRDVIARVNQLYRQPEFYDTITNNCTNNIVRHVNHLKPSRIPYSWQVLLPGFADQHAYRLGLLETKLPFEEARRRAKVNDLALRYGDSPDFSQRIRQ